MDRKSDLVTGGLFAGVSLLLGGAIVLTRDYFARQRRRLANFNCLPLQTVSSAYDAFASANYLPQHMLVRGRIKSEFERDVFKIIKEIEYSIEGTTKRTRELSSQTVVHDFSLTDDNRTISVSPTYQTKAFGLREVLPASSIGFMMLGQKEENGVKKTQATISYVAAEGDSIVAYGKMKGDAKKVTLHPKYISMNGVNEIRKDMESILAGQPLLYILTGLSAACSVGFFIKGLSL